MNFIRRWSLSIILLPVCVYLVFTRGEYSWIDNADLVIHEAGHFLFTPFGHFIYMCGGTLVQILLPSFIAWYFFRNYYKTGVQISLLWLGQNLINISVYAADARAQQLPLLGGSSVHHDWNYILSQLNILESDTQVGYFFFGCAIIIFAAVLLMPFIIRE